MVRGGVIATVRGRISQQGGGGTTASTSWLTKWWTVGTVPGKCQSQQTSGCLFEIKTGPFQFAAVGLSFILKPRWAEAHSSSEDQLMRSRSNTTSSLKLFNCPTQFRSYCWILIKHVTAGVVKQAGLDLHVNRLRLWNPNWPQPSSPLGNAAADIFLLRPTNVRRQSGRPLWVAAVLTSEKFITFMIQTVRARLTIMVASSRSRKK